MCQRSVVVMTVVVTTCGVLLDRKRERECVCECKVPAARYLEVVLTKYLFWCFCFVLVPGCGLSRLFSGLAPSAMDQPSFLF